MQINGAGLFTGSGAFSTEFSSTTPYTISFVIYDSNLPATMTGDAPFIPDKTVGETFIVPSQGNMTRTEQSYSFPPGGGNVIITDVNIPLYGWTDGNSLYFPGDIYTMPNSNITLSAIWLDLYAPSITNISPMSGSIGDIVTITGYGLATVQEVKFWRNKITTFVIVNDNEITAIVPENISNGRITLTVATANGSTIGLSPIFTRI